MKKKLKSFLKKNRGPRKGAAHSGYIVPEAELKRSTNMGKVIVVNLIALAVSIFLWMILGYVATITDGEFRKALKLGRVVLWMLPLLWLILTFKLTEHLGFIERGALIFIFTAFQYFGLFFTTLILGSLFDMVSYSM